MDVDEVRAELAEAIRRRQAAERALAQIGADVEAFPAMRARAEKAEERLAALRRGIAFIAHGGQPCTPDTLTRLLEGDAGWSEEIPNGPR